MLNVLICCLLVFPVKDMPCSIETRLRQLEALCSRPALCTTSNWHSARECYQISTRGVSLCFVDSSRKEWCLPTLSLLVQRDRHTILGNCQTLAFCGRIIFQFGQWVTKVTSAPRDAFESRTRKDQQQRPPYAILVVFREHRGQELVDSWRRSPVIKAFFSALHSNWALLPSKQCKHFANVLIFLTWQWNWPNLPKNCFKFFLFLRKRNEIIVWVFSFWGRGPSVHTWKFFLTFSRP